MNFLQQKRWAPYIVGSLIGMVMVTSYYLTGVFLGISSGCTKFALIFSCISCHYSSSSIYNLSEYFQVVVIFGVVIGSFISSYFSKSFTQDAVPSLWRMNFGDSFTKRALFSFVGGIIVIFGARIAGGCTSGKSIASGLQLLLPAWIFTLSLFSTAVITSFILYRNR